LVLDSNAQTKHPANTTGRRDARASKRDCCMSETGDRRCERLSRQPVGTGRRFVTAMMADGSELV
jgi:hypothetical protein